MPVLPGYLPLSIIRGIEFQERILRCADDSVTVSIDSGPDLLYALSGQFSGYDLYIQTGAPSAFLYFNPTATTYIIADTLTTAGLTNYFICPAVTHPTGTYTGVGSFMGSTAIATDHTVDLTGFTAKSVVRRNSSSDVVIDLNPSITDAANGEITIPGISTADTQDLEDVGTFQWDLVLASGGERQGVFLKGPFVIADNITQIAPT